MKKNILWIIPVLLWGLSCPRLLLAESAADYIVDGNKLTEKEQYLEAIEQYEKAVKIDPKNSRAILLIGLCYARSGDLDKGLSYVELASKKRPSYISFYNLGLIHSARMESDKAIESFDQALAFNPTSFDVEYQKGLVYTNLKKYAQAIPFYLKAVKLNPSLDHARLALFNAFLNEGDRKSASAQIEEFRKKKKMSVVQTLEARMRGSKSSS